MRFCPKLVKDKISSETPETLPPEIMLVSRMRGVSPWNRNVICRLEATQSVSCARCPACAYLHPELLGTLCTRIKRLGKVTSEEKPEPNFGTVFLQD